jgi:hypothetical protein
MTSTVANFRKKRLVLANDGLTGSMADVSPKNHKKGGDGKLFPSLNQMKETGPTRNQNN